MNNQYKDVFISYGRRESLGFVGRLHQQLKLAGYDGWFDKVNIPDGDDYQQRIDHGIESAHNFVCVMAPRCMTSPYCLLELEYARLLGKRVIPINQMVIFDTPEQVLSAGDQQVLVNFYQHFNLPNPQIRTTQEVLNRSLALIGRTDWLAGQEILSDDDCQRLVKWAQPYENNWAKHDDINYLKTATIPVFGDSIDTLDSVVERLIAVLERQTKYVHQHTQILTHALRWQTHQKTTQYLLVGQQRTAAQAWLLTEFTPPEQPPCQPSNLVCEFICEARKNAQNLMTDLFICASTADIEIRNQLLKSLSRYAKTVWTHDRDIQKGTDYQQAIKIGIENADNFIFGLSPDSVNSEHCQRELALALQYHKRIIPLKITPLPDSEIPDELRGLQYIDFTDNHQQTGLDEMLAILQQDFDYYQSHKVLLTQALKWTAEARKPAFLLRGHNLENAKTWLRLHEKRDLNPPLPLHQAFITASLTAGQVGTKVFVSYSRTDSDFARHLNTALQQAGQTCWFDQESIDTGTDFEKEIFKGIDSADNFLFVLSPDAVQSEYCEREVNYAAELGKRFITVKYRETDPNTMPDALRIIQWLDFSNPAEFETAFLELVRALERQQAYVHQHTEILTHALHWQTHQKASQYLLTGHERTAAEQWLLTEFISPEQPPCQPSALMCDVICESRKNAENGMTDIFVCYDVQDQEIRNQVVQSLSRYAKTCWMHDRDIQKGTRYEYAIEQGIEGADNVFFFMSPSSVVSDYCQRELAHALSYHKRIIPLYCAPTPTESMPDALRDLQYIDLTVPKNGRGFQNLGSLTPNIIDELLNLLKQDQDYYKQHKVLLIRSRKWAAANRKPMYLLQGHNLEMAKTWLRLAEQRQQHTPLPLHHELITASEKATHQEGTELFISYSRQDNDFVVKLNTQLQEAGKTVWFDQETQSSSVNASVDFEKETFKGIDNADNFLFVVSPPSVASKYCVAEINHAAQRGKRILAVKHRDIEPEAMPAALQTVPWLDFRARAEFETAFLELVRTLERHQAYIHQHTEILAQALRWQQNQKATQSLLVGSERTAAQDWLSEFLPPAQPPCQPTQLICDFICEARKNAENLMTDIFVCYDVEHDKAIRDRIIQSLSRYAKTCWTHDVDIQKGEQYEDAIERGIEGADNLFFFISEASVASDYCQRELAHALQYHKRVVPLLITPTPIEAMPDALRSLQYVDLTNHSVQADYDSHLDEILNILKQDQDYYKQHKVLLVRGLKWRQENQKPSFLLRGYNLENAKMWLRLSGKRQQHLPLSLHRQLIQGSEAAKGQLGTDVFISYSRTNGDFARQLNTALQEAGFATWFDQESIGSGVDFEKEIYKGIDSADNFVFIVSPEAVKSEYCEREVNYAAELGKRFISVLHRETETLPEALRKINWIDFQTSPFDKSFSELLQSIELDREHAHQHTVLQQRASDWAENNRSRDFLLNITACVNAETWQERAVSENKQPVPTELQRHFIVDSRFAIKKANRRRNSLLVSAFVGMIAAGGLAVVAFDKMKEAERLYNEVFKLLEFSKEEAKKVAGRFVTEQNPVFRDTLTTSRDKGPEMVWLPGGQFRMGDIRQNHAQELPVHQVSIERFAIGRHEVTVGEFRQFINASGYKTQAEKELGCQVYQKYVVDDASWRAPYFPQDENQPVVCVSWHDAVAYTGWLTQETGYTYRLPTEAEWEYAARAGKETQFWWGNYVDKEWGVCQDCGSQWDGKQTAPVDSLIPNPFGLYHAAGNVQEWVADIWHDNYQNAPSDGRVWEAGGEQCVRVRRGGAWDSDSNTVRLSYRSGHSDAEEGSPHFRSHNLGFRVVRQGEPVVKSLENTEKAESQKQRAESVTAEACPEVFKKIEPEWVKKAESIKIAKPFFVNPKELIFRHALTDGGFGPEIVKIPAGQFQMGSKAESDEQPVHQVSIQPFAIGRYEVTFEEYDLFTKSTGREQADDSYGWGRGKRPVIYVSWDDAVAYTVWLSEQTGQPYRLPSEAEWEYAARAGTETAYWWGDQIGTLWANCDGCGSQWDNKQTAPVGSFIPNKFGLYDTVGNVWEWVADPWHGNYEGAPLDGSVWKGEGDDRVLRGGSFYGSPSLSRSAVRDRVTSDGRDGSFGFRVAVPAAWTK